MSETLFHTLTPLDHLVFWSILLLTIGSVIYGTRLKSTLTSKKKSDSPVEVLLDGRRLTLPLFIATLVATWYGGIFGVTQIAYDHGIYNFITQGVFWYLTYLIFAFFLADKLRNTDTKTLPELAGKLFGHRAKNLVSIFNILNVLPIAYAMSIGIFLDGIFSTGVFWGTIMGTLVVILYSVFGGFRAIVFSDLIQFFVMILAVSLVLIFSVINFGGYEYLQKNLPPTHFSITGGLPISSLIVWGLIALSTLVDPNFYQRVFAARDNTTARKGILLSTIIWCLFDICTTAGAMYAAANLQGVDSASAYLVYAMEVLPSGLRGLFLAGVLATILSTLDSYLFIASTTLVYDLFKKRSSILGIHHLSTIVFGVVAACLSFYFSGNIKDVWKTLGSYSAGCVLFPMMLALLTRVRIRDLEFVVASIVGAFSITIWRHAPRPEALSEIDDLFVGVLATAIVIAICQIRYRFNSI